MARQTHLDKDTAHTLRDLTEMGRPDFVGELISVFLDTFSGQLTMLIEQAAEGDTHGLRRTSHELRSSSAGMGAFALATRCRELEDLVCSGTTRGTAAMVRRIVDEFHAVRPELDALLLDPA